MYTANKQNKNIHQAPLLLQGLLSVCALLRENMHERVKAMVPKIVIV